MQLMRGEIEFNTQTEADAAGAKALADLHTDWKLLSEAIAFDVYVLVEPAKEHEPTGPLPYRVSTDERKWLRARIQKLFGERIAAYKQAKTNGDTSSVSAIVFGVMHLEELLVAEQYRAN